MSRLFLLRSRTNSFCFFSRKKKHAYHLMNQKGRNVAFNFLLFRKRTKSVRSARLQRIGCLPLRSRANALSFFFLKITISLDELNALPLSMAGVVAVTWLCIYEEQLGRLFMCQSR
jgi:hypothetical protein